ncbi:MAG: hypothetical protein PUJ51_20650 [Clostridiales bacterium]|nr:hypothetical protein [Clostridiales bacterium]
MRKIKWENIVLLVMIILGVVSMVHHIKLNGWYNNLVIEAIVYLLISVGARYLVKDIRKNPSNWTL